MASRVSAAVLQKNEGYTYISQVNEEALLSPGIVSKLHGIRMDKKKLWNKKQQSSIAFKRRRLLLKKRKHKREYSLHLHEGHTYGSNIESAAVLDIESIPGKLDPKKGKFIMFDIETTGLSRDSDIVQLSAFDGNTEFNIYIRPNQPISKNATAISGITFSFENNTIYYNGREVKSEDIRTGLLKFLAYLQSHDNPILVGHNIMLYDIPVLCQKFHECSMLSEFTRHVYGCADTLKLARKLYKKEEVGNYKQSNLVNILLGKSYVAHNSLEDVKILHELFTKKLICHSEDLFPFLIHILQKSFKPMVEQKAMSVATSRKIAGSGLGVRHIILAHKRDELSGVKTLLGEHGIKGKVVSKVVQYLINHEE